jgi:hypothetical protein
LDGVCVGAAETHLHTLHLSIRWRVLTGERKRNRPRLASPPSSPSRAGIITAEINTNGTPQKVHLIPVAGTNGLYTISPITAPNGSDPHGDHHDEDDENAGEPLDEATQQEILNGLNHHDLLEAENARQQAGEDISGYTTEEDEQPMTKKRTKTGKGKGPNDEDESEVVGIPDISDTVGK